MLNDCNGSDDGSAIEIKVGLDKADFEAIDSAWGALIRALVDHDAGSPGQALAWENGMAKMPQALRDLLPPLARLNELALKAWPSIKDLGVTHLAGQCIPGSKSEGGVRK